MRLQPETWGIASGDAGSGKTTVAACLGAILQQQGLPALILDADLRGENYLLSASVSSEPDALSARVLSEGYLLILRRSLGDDFDRTIRGLESIVPRRKRSALQLLLDFGTGSSEKYAEFFPLLSNPVVVADRTGESVAKALSFAYRAVLRCIGRRLRRYPEVTRMIRQALTREAEGSVTRLSELAYHLIGVNRYAAEVARSIIRAYHPKVVLNRSEEVQEQKKLRRLLAQVRLETDLDISFGGTLANEPRLAEVAAQATKLSLDDPESEYAIWLARELARKLQGESRIDPQGAPPTKPTTRRRRWLGGLLGSVAMFWTVSPKAVSLPPGRRAGLTTAGQTILGSRPFDVTLSRYVRKGNRTIV